MILRPYGERACLLDCASADERRALASALRADPPPGAVDVVAAALTVLVRFASPAAAWEFSANPPRVDDVTVTVPEGPLLRVPVRYDGPDLHDVAALVAMSIDELISWHTGQTWVCDFVGFLPGFGYLVGERPLAVPRRASPRTSIPGGSVALAGEYAGIYPSASPGGWQLIGTAVPPAPYPAGTRIRFERAAC